MLNGVSAKLFLYCVYLPWCCFRVQILFKGVRSALNAIHNRIQPNNKIRDAASALFEVDLVLSIPKVEIRPSLDEIQLTLTKLARMIVKVVENIPPWNSVYYTPTINVPVVVSM